MTEKELRKMNRMELLSLLLDSYREVELLQSRIGQLEETLRDRELMIQNVGNIADASLQLNQVFTVAQAAADQFLENVRLKCARTEAETEAKARQILAQAEMNSVHMEEEAKRRSENYWKQVEAKIQDVICAHPALKYDIELVAQGSAS